MNNVNPVIAIFVTMAIIVVGILTILLFQEWAIRDERKKQKARMKEVDRLLDLDEYEKKIS